MLAAGCRAESSAVPSSELTNSVTLTVLFFCASLSLSAFFSIPGDKEMLPVPGVRRSLGCL